MGQLGTIAAKTVGNQDIGTSSGIFGMNPHDDRGSRSIHLFRAATGRQTTLLEQGPHGTVKNQHPLPDS